MDYGNIDKNQSKAYRGISDKMWRFYLLNYRGHYTATFPDLCVPSKTQTKLTLFLIAIRNAPDLTKITWNRL